MLKNREGLLINLLTRMEAYYLKKDELSENILNTAKDNKADIERNALELDILKTNLLKSFKKLFVVDETNVVAHVRLADDVQLELETTRVEIYNLQQMRKALLESSPPRDRRYVMEAFNVLSSQVMAKISNQD